MKKYCILALTIVLTAALFAGCGCTNRNVGSNTSAPTLLPTTEATRATTEATTEMTTEHTTVPTTHETIDNGNGPVENTPNGTNGNGTATEGTANGTVEGRAHTPNVG